MTQTLASLPVIGRVGGSLRTYTGLRIYPLDAREDEICIEDIAKALSHICRYTGQLKTFYSVAEHSVRVSEVVNHFHQIERLGVKESILTALLHDAPEAYLTDLPRPLKQSPGFGELYQAAEDKLYSVIARKFHLIDPIPDIVHKADDILLVTELRDFRNETNVWSGAPRPLYGTIKPMTSKQAETAFLKAYRYLTRSY